MSSIVDCPSCHRKLQVPEDLLGKKVQCPTCGTQFSAALEDVAAPRKAPVLTSAPALGELEDDEPVPKKRRDADEEEYHVPDRRRPRRGDDKPGKVQAIAIMTLIGGILATVGSVAWLAYVGLVGVATFGFGLLCCLWPGPYYGLVVGIMAIIRGSALLGQNAHLQPAPKGIAIMQIINIVNGDIPNCVMGILTLVFLNEPEVRDYFRR